MRCPICDKQVPFTLPPYMRIYKGKDGHWHVYKDICQCNKEMYKFCVLDLLKKKETVQGNKIRKEELEENKRLAKIRRF